MMVKTADSCSSQHAFYSKEHYQGMQEYGGQRIQAEEGSGNVSGLKKEVTVNLNRKSGWQWIWAENDDGCELEQKRVMNSEFNE